MYESLAKVVIKFADIPTVIRQNVTDGEIVKIANKRNPAIQITVNKHNNKASRFGLTGLLVHALIIAFTVKTPIPNNDKTGTDTTLIIPITNDEMTAREKAIHGYLCANELRRSAIKASGPMKLRYKFIPLEHGKDIYYYPTFSTKYINNNN